MKETQIGRQYTQMSKASIIYIYITTKTTCSNKPGNHWAYNLPVLHLHRPLPMTVFKNRNQTHNPLIKKQFLIRFLVESEDIKYKQNTGDTLGKYQGNVTNEHVRILRPVISNTETYIEGDKGRQKRETYSPSPSSFTSRGIHGSAIIKWPLTLALSLQQKRKYSTFLATKQKISIFSQQSNLNSFFHCPTKQKESTQIRT